MKSTKTPPRFTLPKAVDIPVSGKSPTCQTSFFSTWTMAHSPRMAAAIPQRRADVRTANLATHSFLSRTSWRCKRAGSNDAQIEQRSVPPAGDDHVVDQRGAEHGRGPRDHVRKL